MTAATMVSFRAPLLPWSVATDDDARFRRISQRVLGICLVLFIAMPWLPVSQPDRTQPQDLPPPLAKLLLEREPPPPPPPVVKPERLKDAAQDTLAALNKPEVVKPKQPEPSKAAPVPEARRPVADKPPGEVDAARRKAAGVGLLAMANELAEIRGAPIAVQLRTDIKQGPGVGTGSGPGVGAGTDNGIPIRSMITSNAQGGSGGINTAAYSRNTGGGGLAGRATTLVEGAAGGGGGGGPGGGGGGGKGNGTGLGSGDGARNGGSIAKGGSGKASRSLEDIKIVLERSKGSLYSIYNRALRDDASLQGKVVVELKISPSGEVMSARVISSELKTPDLEAKILARIRTLDFGAKDVAEMVTTWPLDFLPA